MVNLVYKVGGEKHCHPIKTPEELIAACNTPENIQNWNDFRSTGEDRYKHALVQVNYNGQVPDGGLLKGIKTVSPFFFYDIDCRDREECRRIINQLLQMKEELGLVEVAESASFGVHAVARRMPGHTILECQVRMSILTKTEMDTNNKENNRVVFHGPIDAETTPLLDPVLFTESLSDEEAAAEYLLLKEREAQGLEEVPAGAKKSNKHYRPWEEVSDTQGTVPQCSASCAQQGQSPCVQQEQSPCVAEPKKFPTEFKGVPYTSIISEYWRRTGGEPTEGERNKRLHQLTANLRAICDNSEPWLMEVMPRYGLSESEMKTIIHSACKEPTKGSRLMDAIIDHLTLTSAHSDEDDFDGIENGQSSRVNVQLNKLPLGLKESLAGVPVAMHMPVLCSVMPLAAAYADQITVRYCDGEMQKLGMMSIIYGEQASGKSVCKHAVNIWKRQFDEEDELARKREDEWKERKKSRKANEKAPADPKVLIRVVPVTVSCSTLLKRLKNANGHTLFSFGEELDTLRKTNGAGSWSSKYDIYRLAFDPLDSEWGQDYNSDQAESGVVKVAYNWSMLGTNGAVRKCFKGDNIENGLSSRILLAEMPDTSFAKMPRYGRRSAEDEARIQEAVTRLRSYSGYIDTPRLRKAIDQWVEEQRVEALKDIDHVKDTYRRRAAVIGFRCGVIFHLLSGKDKESRACLDFALMMASYCLEQQMKVFGQALQNQYVDAQQECQRYGANNSIFDQLPPTFTADDLAALKPSSVSRNSIIKIISRWNRDGWISKADQKRWSKVKAKSDNDKVTK